MLTNENFFMYINVLEAMYLPFPFYSGRHILAKFMDITKHTIAANVFY